MALRSRASRPTEETRMLIDTKAKLTQVSTKDVDFNNPIQGVAVLQAEHLHITIDLTREQLWELQQHFPRLPKVRIRIEIDDA